MAVPLRSWMSSLPLPSCRSWGSASTPGREQRMFFDYKPRCPYRSHLWFCRPAPVGPMLPSCLPGPSLKHWQGRAGQVFTRLHLRKASCRGLGSMLESIMLSKLQGLGSIPSTAYKRYVHVFKRKHASPCGCPVNADVRCGTRQHKGSHSRE